MHQTPVKSMIQFHILQLNHKQFLLSKISDVLQVFDGFFGMFSKHVQLRKVQILTISCSLFDSFIPIFCIFTKKWKSLFNLNRIFSIFSTFSMKMIKQNGPISKIWLNFTPKMTKSRQILANFVHNLSFSVTFCQACTRFHNEFF